MPSKIKIEYFAPSELTPNPWNSNHVSPDMEVKLEASLKEFGFIKPVLVRELADGSKQIIGGEHRARKAKELGITEVPVVVLKGIDDKRAKAMGLADNGRYGQDNALELAEILGDIGTDLIDLLPYDEKDLAGIFASADVDLGALGLDDINTDDIPSLSDIADAPRATITHELMRFKVPIEDRDRVQRVIESVIKRKGLASEKDSLVAVGMALVELVNLAEPQL